MLEEPLKIFRRWWNVVKSEKFPDEIHIRAPGKIDFLDTVRCIELGCERFCEGSYAGMTRVNERAVDVEQNESHHASGS